MPFARSVTHQSCAGTEAHEARVLRDALRNLGPRPEPVAEGQPPITSPHSPLPSPPPPRDQALRSRRNGRGCRRHRRASVLATDEIGAQAAEFAGEGVRLAEQPFTRLTVLVA